MWPFKSKKLNSAQTVKMSDGEQMAQELLAGEVLLSIHCDGVDNGRVCLRSGLTLNGKAIDASAMQGRINFLYAGDTLNISGLKLIVIHDH